MSGIGQMKKVLHNGHELSDFQETRVRSEELFSLVEPAAGGHAGRSWHADSFARLRAEHRELQDAYLDAIYRLVLASECRDDSTGDHCIRIGHFSAFLAHKLGLPMHDVCMLRHAAPMHDMGKIGISDKILLKRGNLTSREFETIKSHTVIGARMLEKAKSEILRLGHSIALSHHENWDGSGYPFGLSGESIPITGRIVRVMDVFHALTSARPYKIAYPLDLALEIIRRGRGTDFDPEVLDAFLKNIDVLVRNDKEQSEIRKASRKIELSRRDEERYAALSGFFRAS